MEATMGGLTHKTTILLSPELHERLARLAAQRGTSIGDLIRSACERLYGLGGSEERVAAARELASMSLPVGSPAQMKSESVVRPEELLP
ncbi:MAG: CopG family transcriptional regulator [Longimicrobiales bacterium]